MMDSRQVSKPCEDELLVVLKDKIAYAAIRGRGSFQIAPAIKKFCLSVIGQECNHLVIDMSECIGMDSTFMGSVAGLAGRLKKTNQTLELINLSEKNAQLLKTLGVDQVLSFYKDAHGHQLSVQKTTTLPTDQTSQKEMAETALQAHEKLVQISDENLPKFKQVIELLKEDVDRLN